jgi:hypothetical protein
MELPRPRAILAASAVLLALPAAPAGAGGARAAAAGCGAFASQAEAQARFAALNGTPRRDAGGLDGDGDGVACEGRPGPYAGFATIGYNAKRSFFYGTASMPPRSGGGFACLAGNSHFAEGPRLLRIYRVRPGPDLVVSRPLGAEAKPSSGRLLWKLDVPLRVPGRYYAAFEEEVRLSPYQPSECPGFSSPATLLPQPKSRRAQPVAW